MIEEIEKCPHCNQLMPRKYWHKLTPGLVNALVKFRRALLLKGENSVHLLKDMEGKFDGDGISVELSRHEWNNFTKLRFHGLAVHDKKAGRGYWLLTSRGAAFLRGELAVPKRVQTTKNVVTGHSEDLTNIKEVYGTIPRFEDIDDIESETMSLEETQTQLI